VKRWTFVVIAFVVTFALGSLLTLCTRSERCLDHHGEFSGRACP